MFSVYLFILLCLLPLHSLFIWLCLLVWKSGMELLLVRLELLHLKLHLLLKLRVG